MKHFLKIAGFAVISAAVAMGQSNPNSGASQSQQPIPGASQSQGAIPSGQPQNTVQQPTPSPKQPAAKTQEEHTAYLAVAGNHDPAASFTGAQEFAKKYPDSELTAPLYAAVMQNAFNAGNNEVTIDAARKVIAVQPEHTMALVMLATGLAETTKNTDMDRDEKWNEAMKSADKAIATADKGMAVVAPQATPDQLEGAKATLISMAHSAMGYVTMAKSDWTESEKHFKASVADARLQPDPVNYLRLAVAQDNLKKYSDGIASAKKAAQLADAAQNTQVANMARAEQARLEKLSGGK
jgi:hypothetical protein